MWVEILAPDLTTDTTGSFIFLNLKNHIKNADNRLCMCVCKDDCENSVNL